MEIWKRMIFPICLLIWKVFTQLKRWIHRTKENWKIYHQRRTFQQSNRRKLFRIGLVGDRNRRRQKWIVPVIYRTIRTFQQSNRRQLFRIGLVADLEKELKQKSAYALKSEIAEATLKGDKLIAPHVPNLNQLRVIACKSECAPNGENAIVSLYELRKIHVNRIQKIDYFPFTVYYATPAQSAYYKKETEYHQWIWNHQRITMHTFSCMLFVSKVNMYAHKNGIVQNITIVVLLLFQSCSIGTLVFLRLQFIHFQRFHFRVYN